jgi:dolichyl-phosphate-mannose--protein O-mannosyl transferase
MIWWGGTLALGVVAFQWLLARDWRAGAIAIGVIGGYLPWFLYQQRTIFQFYAVAFVPWMVLAVTYCLGLIIGPRHGPPRRRRIAAAVAGSYVFVAVMMFWFFYPVLAGRLIPHGSWALRMWFPSWI